MKTTAIIRCPNCGHEQAEEMPTDSCLIRYTCTSCETVLRPKAGDCCVFCSYADTPCPPLQDDTPSIELL